MRVLVVSDEPDKKYWDYYKDGVLDEFDLILSAGDLPPQYLSFLVTFSKCPVLYVHGNHDDCYKETPPDGCYCIDGKLVEYNGLRILGLGGSRRYKLGDNQYSEKEMERRIKKLRFSLFRKKGFDILLTHSPAKDLGDGDDRAHTGFECFIPLLDKYKPKYFFFGHQHTNYGRSKLGKDARYNSTKLFNATKSIIVDIET